MVCFRKREKLFVDASGNDWSDIFWRCGEEGFCCQMNPDFKGLTFLRCVRWNLPRLEICPCPIGCPTEPLVNNGNVPGAILRLFWFPAPYVCKKKWDTLTLWKVNQNNNLYKRSPHAKAYHIYDDENTWVDFRFNGIRQPYAPLSNDQVKKLTPTADYDACVDEHGRKLIRFSHVKQTLF